MKPIKEAEMGKETEIFIEIAEALIKSADNAFSVSFGSGSVCKQEELLIALLQSNRALNEQNRAIISLLQDLLQK